MKNHFITCFNVGNVLKPKNILNLLIKHPKKSILKLFGSSEKIFEFSKIR